MQTYQPSLIARHDTLLGVCEALGEDLGFNPLWLRAAFAAMVFFNLGAAVAIYLGAGLVVLASRLIYRSRRKPMPQPAAAPAGEARAEAAPVEAGNDDLTVMAAAA